MAALLMPLLATGVPPAARAADVGISIRIGDRYQGSELRFTNRPRLVVIPRTNVYYVQNYDVDVYRYGRFYYAYDRGRWWRATSYRGPWYYIRGRAVPRQIFIIPADYRRNWRGDYGEWRERDYDQNWEQSWGHRERGRDVNRAQDENRGHDMGRGEEMNRGRETDRSANPGDQGNQKDKGKRGNDKGGNKGNRGH
ncbi:MAG TPA: hypothetical protein VE326_08535 [Candidatus Binatia bacterium]|nr:hypothetical protein [Candidatus Binatia bacterium]